MAVEGSPKDGVRIVASVNDTRDRGQQPVSGVVSIHRGGVEGALLQDAGGPLH